VRKEVQIWCICPSVTGHFKNSS